MVAGRLHVRPRVQSPGRAARAQAEARRAPAGLRRVEPGKPASLALQIAFGRRPAAAWAAVLAQADARATAAPRRRRHQQAVRP
jgi:hypothetical protein